MTPEPIIEIQLTQPQVQALGGLLDAGLRATGIRAARDAAELIGIIEAAVAATQAKPVGNGKTDSLERTND
jgi:hypothetical protein